MWPVRVWWVISNYFKFILHYSSKFLYSSNVALTKNMLLKHAVHLQTCKQIDIWCSFKIICLLNIVVIQNNMETLILGTQHTMTVTIIKVENELQMSQNSKLLNLTTKATIKRLGLLDRNPVPWKSGNEMLRWKALWEHSLFDRLLKHACQTRQILA